MSVYKNVENSHFLLNFQVKINLCISGLLKRCSNSREKRNSSIFLFFQLLEFSKCKTVLLQLPHIRLQERILHPALILILPQEEMCKYLLNINISEFKYHMHLFQTFLSYLLILVLVPAKSFNCLLPRVQDHKSI